MNLRGRYEGGGCVVTSKHWWSPRDRKDAQTAAKILEYQWGERKRAARLMAAMLANSSVISWEPTQHETPHEGPDVQS
jgi:hypothetical protein